MALEHLDARGLQPAALGVVLHPFRHDTQRQAAREQDHRRHHADILRQHIDEYFIDFQNIHRQSFHLLQLVQPGITHAKIIQRNLYPGLAQRSKAMATRASHLIDAYGHHLVPIYRTMRETGYLRFHTNTAADWFHPNDKGYRAWADLFWETIEASGRLDELRAA